MSVGLFVILIALEEGPRDEDNFVLDALARDTVLQSGDVPVTDDTQLITKWLNREWPTEFCDVMDSALARTTNTFAMFQGSSTKPPHVKCLSSVEPALHVRQHYSRFDNRTKVAANPGVVVPGPKTIMNNFHYIVFTLDGYPTNYTDSRNQFFRMLDYGKGQIYFTSMGFLLNTANGMECRITAPGSTTTQQMFTPDGYMIVGKIYIMGLQWKVEQENVTSGPEDLMVFTRNPDDNQLLSTKFQCPVVASRTNSERLLFMLAGAHGGSTNMSIHEVGSLKGIKTDQFIDTFTNELHNKWRVPNASWQP